MIRDALEKKCGVSRERIACIESGDSIPTFHLGARLAHGMGMTLAAFVGKLEDGAGGVTFCEVGECPDPCRFCGKGSR